MCSCCKRRCCAVRKSWLLQACCGRLPVCLRQAACLPSAQCGLRQAIAQYLGVAQCSGRQRRLATSLCWQLHADWPMHRSHEQERTWGVLRAGSRLQRNKRSCNKVLPGGATRSCSLQTWPDAEVLKDEMRPWRQVSFVFSPPLHGEFNWLGHPECDETLVAAEFDVAAARRNDQCPGAFQHYCRPER